MDQQLTENEEKALVGILYNHVSFGTTMQVFGETDEDNGRINTLRTILEKLLIKYDLIESLAPDVLLLMGITSRIPKEKILAWAADDTNRHLQMRARYFLRKLNAYNVHNRSICNIMMMKNILSRHFPALYQFLCKIKDRIAPQKEPGVNITMVSATGLRCPKNVSWILSIRFRPI